MQGTEPEVPGDADDTGCRVFAEQTHRGNGVPEMTVIIRKTSDKLLDKNKEI